MAEIDDILEVGKPKVESDKPEKRDYTDILEEARDRFERISQDDKDNHDSQRTDTLFVYSPGQQWPDTVRRERTQNKEICLEFNQLKQFVAQVVNDQRQNRPGIRIHPAGGAASKEVAEILQGMIRGIEYDSKADAAYDNGFQQSVVGGRGWWRVISKYVDDKTFDQKLVIEPILDSNTVYADTNYQQPDGSDRMFVFVTEAIHKDEFARRYPDAEPISFETIGAYWAPMQDYIVIADYYRRICTKRKMVRMSDGAQGWKDEMPNPPEGVTVLRERECDCWSVEWFTIAGGQQVLEEYDWPGTIIPVIGTVGDDMMLDGKRIYQGLTRHARDAQSMLNFGMTQQAIRLSLTPRTPWILTAEQVKGYENFWKEANVKNYSYLPYNAFMSDGQTPAGLQPPQRNEPSVPDAGYINWCQTMVQMIKSTIGMYEQSLGQKGQEISGKAINERKQQGNNATFNYVDNLSRAIALTGLVILECIPPFYDTPRIVHIVGLDETRRQVTINQQAPDLVSGALKAIEESNISGVKSADYAVTSQAGPGYATKRQETASMLSDLVSAYPPIMQIAGDLVVRAQDIPDADVIADRLKIMLPPPIQAQMQAKDQGKPPPDPQMLAQMQQQQAHLDQAAQTMQVMDQKIKSLESGAQVKVQAAQMDAQARKEIAATDAQVRAHEAEFAARQKAIAAELDAQTKREQAQRDAEIDLEKARIDADKSIQIAMIQRETALEVAQIQAGVDLHIAATKPVTEPASQATESSSSSRAAGDS